MQRLDAKGIDNTKMAAHGTVAARHASSGQLAASPHETSLTTTNATDCVSNGDVRSFCIGRFNTEAGKRAVGSPAGPVKFTYSNWTLARWHMFPMNSMPHTFDALTAGISGVETFFNVHEIAH